MTDPTRLHEAAGVVASMAETLEKLNDLIDPDLEAFVGSLAEHRDETGDMPQEVWDRLAVESGFRALVDACCLLGTITTHADKIVTALDRAAWRESA